MSIVVALLNQKGGVGKTTAATNLATMLHSDGEPTLLVDLDPQGSATAWADEREGDDICPVVRMGKSLPRDLPKVARGYKWVIIDGAPQISELAAAAVKASNIVLIPVQPSPYDVWACADLVELIKARQEVTDGNPRAAFVISRAIKNTRLSREVDDALQSYDLPIFRAKTCQRIDYIETAKYGGTVMNLGEDHQARHEIKMLCKELREFAK